MARSWLTAGVGKLRLLPDSLPSMDAFDAMPGAAAPPALPKIDPLGNAVTSGVDLHGVGKLPFAVFDRPFPDLSRPPSTPTTPVAGTGFSGTPGTGGALGRAAGEFDRLNAYDDDFRAASAQFGIPANMLKAIAMIERGWEGTSPSGAVGLMQVMPQYWGDKGYDIYNDQGNIMAGALAFKSFYDQYRQEAITRGMDPWEAAARAYLAGNPWSTASDAYGTTTDIYGKRFRDYYRQLEQAVAGAVSPGLGGVPSPGGMSLQSIFGSDARVEGWGEFNVPSSNGMYGYGTRYGLNGVNHTGLDVPLPRGTPYRAPMSGVVTCAGTGVGQGAEGGGCAAFSDDKGGAGRVEVLLDNGVVLIFGHSASAALQPGMRFNAGAVLGTSGFQVSDHIHLEARVRDPSTPSGWRIVDPRSVLGGGSFGGTFGGGAPAPMAPAIRPGSSDYLRRWVSGG